MDVAVAAGAAILAWKGEKNVGKLKRNPFSRIFFFQAEDGIRDAQESRGLGDVYKRQTYYYYVHYIF